MLKVIMDSSVSDHLPASLPWLAHLIGKPYQEAQSESYRLGYQLRITEINGLGVIVTADHRSNRLNVGVRADFYISQHDLENYPLDWRHQLDTHANYIDAIHGFY